MNTKNPHSELNAAAATAGVERVHTQFFISTSNTHGRLYIPYMPELYIYIYTTPPLFSIIYNARIFHLAVRYFSFFGYDVYIHTLQRELAKYRFRTRIYATHIYVYVL